MNILLSIFLICIALFVGVILGVILFWTRKINGEEAGCLQIIDNDEGGEPYMFLLINEPDILFNKKNNSHVYLRVKKIKTNNDISSSKNPFR